MNWRQKCAHLFNSNSRLHRYIWDLPDFPKFMPGMSTDDYLAVLRHHKLACEEWEREYADIGSDPNAAKGRP